MTYIALQIALQTSYPSWGYMIYNQIEVPGFLKIFYYIF